jgi:hypothetical protein
MAEISTNVMKSRQGDDQSLKRGGGRSHFMMAVNALSSNISSARDSSPSQPQSFAINARTAQKFTLPMYKFPPPDKDTTEASATQDGGGSTSEFVGWPFTPQQLQIDTGRPGHPTSNASGDSASREPTSPTFSVQSGSTRSNKSSAYRHVHI